jgi:ectonucleotide pyrophosphatase/phosphodiesterase family protein 1/3
VNTALSRVDDTMKSLFDGLKERGVEDCVNIIIVSDHGMATYNSSRLVHLKEVHVP